MDILINRNFKIWSYSVSHSTLILRSPMMFEDQEEYRKELNFNIDIEFSGVAYIDLPNRIEEIKIREIKDMVPAKFQLYRTIVGLKIFEIKSHKKLYYIVASNFVIGKNKWLNEDRVFNMSLEYDEILSFG